MPKKTSKRPQRITLVWGADRLVVDDPIWIDKIVQEMAEAGQPDEDYGLRLRRLEPRSRRREMEDATFRAWAGIPSSAGPEAPTDQVGYQAPKEQGAVVAEALKVFLGLELPVALNFTYWGRSRHRMSAVHTYFRPTMSNYWADDLKLCWMCSGYQLYANHQIGSAYFRPYSTDSSGHIERRLLDGQWVRWGFDGASPPPAGRRWSPDRHFIFEDGSIYRLDQDDPDPAPETESDYSEVEDDAEDGMPPSQETI